MNYFLIHLLKLFQIKQEIKYSIGLGAGIGCLLIMIQMVTQIYDSKFFKYCSPLSLFNPDQIIKYNSTALMGIGILFTLSVLFFKGFRKKDLTL